MGLQEMVLFDELLGLMKLARVCLLAVAFK